MGNRVPPQPCQTPRGTESCSSWPLLRLTGGAAVIFANRPFYGFWHGPIGQSALCFSLGGPYFYREPLLRRVARVV